MAKFWRVAAVAAVLVAAGALLAPAVLERQQQTEPRRGKGRTARRRGRRERPVPVLAALRGARRRAGLSRRRRHGEARATP